MTNFISEEVYGYAIKMANVLVKAGLNENRTSYGESSFHTWFNEKSFGSYGFEYYNGVSKVCLFHDALENYVIKFGFSDIASQRDYCMIEYQNYQLAKENGFAAYFPYTDFLGNFDGVNFFIQERACCSEDDITSKWYENMREVMEDYHDESEDEDEINSRVWDAVYDMDDIDRANLTFEDDSFLDFLMEYEIGDLHEGNFGYIDDRIVIIDFSGWKG